MIDGGSVEIRIEGDVSPLRRSVEEAAQQIDEFGNVWSQTASDIDKSLDSNETHYKKLQEAGTTAADGIVNAFSQVLENSDGLASSLKQIGSSLLSIGSAAVTAGLTAASASLVNMAKGAISETSALENVQIQMIGLTHSVEKGNKAMAMAVKYFKNNPFNRFEVTNATKSLIQFGAKLDDIPNLLDKLGKVALSTGTQIDTIAYYYQRNISDGRIATRDLIQMQNQGIPIFQALAKQMNTTSGAVRELAAKGKVSIEDFQKAFDNLVDDTAMERFNNTLARQIDRFKGRMSNMKAALAGYTTTEEGGLEIAAEGLYRSATKFLKTFADIMDSEIGQRIYEGFSKLGKAIGGVIDKITSLMKPAMNIFGEFLNFIGDNSAVLIPILGGLALKLTNIASKLPGLGPVIKAVTGNIDGLYNSIRELVTAHPLLSALMALFSVGFVQAIKTDKEFKKTIEDLGSALKDIISVLAEAGKGVFSALVDVVKELASQGVIKGTLQAVATALKVMAQAIASIPPEMLAGLMSFILSLKLLNTSPLAYAITLIGMFATYVEQIGSLPEALKTIGHNMMTGLFNGLKEGATKVFNFVKDVARTVIDTFRNMWGIHSPSTVAYELGQNWVLGLTYGVEDSSNALQVAMDNLATDILKLSEKIISNKVSFGLLDYKTEYKEWKKVSKLFAQGSEQYNQAIEKMEDARKEANLKILDLQKTYNNELDSTIKKIGSMYGLLSEVDLSGGRNAQQILSNLDKQVAKMSEWATAQEKILGLGLDSSLVEELQALGVENTAELSAIANMTSAELSTLNEMWLKKQEIANKAGIKQMASLKEDTLKEIDEIKKGIDDSTIDITDVGGRLVESISEGVYGAMPTLESAFAQLGDYIARAKRKIGGDNTGGGNEDSDDGLIAGVKKEIEANLENLKNMLPNIMLGAIGAWGALKFGPKILKAIFNKIGQGLLGGGTVSQGIAGALFKSADLGGGLKPLLNNIGDALMEGGTASQGIAGTLYKIAQSKDVEKTAKEVSKISKPAETIARNTQSISTSVASTGQSMSKTSSWMNTVKEGAKTIIYIAGAIAAVAGALWVTYNALKDVDFLRLAEDLVAMGVAVTEFGVLAALADKFVGIKGILAIIGIAVDIAAVAVACRVAYEAMKVLEWDTFARILGQMFAALAVFGTAAGIFGMTPVALAEALGLVVIAGIALDVVALSKACREAYDTMSGMNWEEWGNMLGAMINSLGVIGGFQALLGLLAPLEFLGWGVVMTICDSLIKISKAIIKVDRSVPEDFGDIEKKLYNIKKTLEIINGVDLGTLIGAIVTSWSVDPLTKTMDMYARVGEQLARISELTIDEQKVSANLDVIKRALEQVRSKTDALSGWLQAWSDEANARSVEATGSIVTVFGNMVDSLNKIADFEVKESLYGKITEITGVVEYIQTTVNGKLRGNSIQAFERNLGAVESIVNKFSEMIPVIEKQITGQEVDIEGAKTVITNVADVVEAIGKDVKETANIKNKEKIVGLTQSILNKFTGIIPTVKQLIDEGLTETDVTNAKTAIASVRNLVYEIGKINQASGIENKEKIVGYTQSILNKFTGLVPTIAQLIKQVDENDISNASNIIAKVRNLVYEIGQINQNESDSLENKDRIVAKSIDILKKLKEFSETAGSLKEVNDEVVKSVTNASKTIVETTFNTLDEDALKFENIGVKMGQNLSNGLDSQVSAVANVGVRMQSAFWNAIQSRFQDEYYQGEALGKTFRQGLYDVDYGNAGWWAVQGFINGAWGKAGSGDGVYNAGWWIADRFLKGLKDRGEQGSPWKTTFESGKWAVEGLIEGVRNSEDELVVEAESLADKLVEALTVDDLSISPDFNASVSTAPQMISGEYGIVGGNGRNITVNQVNNNYSQYDYEQSQRDMYWALSKV